jgi:hypothetical protein
VRTQAAGQAAPYSSDSRDIARYRADALTTAADHAVEEERQQAVAAAHLRHLASRKTMLAAAELAAAELAAAINCCTYYHQRKGRTRDKEVTCHTVTHSLTHSLSSSVLFLFLRQRSRFRGGAGKAAPEPPPGVRGSIAKDELAARRSGKGGMPSP